MTYYDHATSMVLKLGRWSEPQAPSNYEKELLACAERARSKLVSNKLIRQDRCSGVDAAPAVKKST